MEYAYNDTELKEKIKDRQGIYSSKIQGSGRDEPGSAVGNYHESRNRSIIQVSIDDAAQADKLVTILMGIR